MANYVTLILTNIQKSLTYGIALKNIIQIFVRTHPYMSIL